jgi:cell division protein FtsL
MQNEVYVTVFCVLAFIYFQEKEVNKLLNRNFVNISRIEYVLNILVDVTFAFLSVCFNVATLLKDFFHVYITV